MGKRPTCNTEQNMKCLLQLVDVTYRIRENPTLNLVPSLPDPLISYQKLHLHTNLNLNLKLVFGQIPFGTKDGVRVVGDLALRFKMCSALAVRRNLMQIEKWRMGLDLLLGAD